MIEPKLKVKNANSGQLFRPDWVSSAEGTYTSSIFVRGPLLSIVTCNVACTSTDRRLVIKSRQY